MVCLLFLLENFSSFDLVTYFFSFLYNPWRKGSHFGCFSPFSADPRCCLLGGWVVQPHSAACLQGAFLAPFICTPYSLCSPHRVTTLASDAHYIRVTPLLLVFTVSRVTPFALDVHCIRADPLAFGPYPIRLTQNDGSPSQFIGKTL